MKSSEHRFGYRSNGTRRTHAGVPCHECGQGSVGSLDSLDGKGTPIPFCSRHAPLVFMWDNMDDHKREAGRSVARLMNPILDRLAHALRGFKR